MAEGETKRGPSGNSVGIDGPEFHARSTCAYPYASPCQYCVPDADRRFDGGDESRVQALMAEVERLREALRQAEATSGMAENKRLREALRECARLSGADLSDGFPTWPDLPTFVVQEVGRLRADYDEDGEFWKALDA